MKKKKSVMKWVAMLLVMMLVCGCGDQSTDTSTSPTNAAEVTTAPADESTPAPTAESTPAPTEEATPTPEALPGSEFPIGLNGATDGSATDESVTAGTSDYIKLALNVYYNDGDSSYYKNESGTPIYVTKEGQYALSFDCDQDLSDEAKSQGVRFLQNLTAVYILDMGIGVGAASPLSACNIKYDAVYVNDTELTITKTEPKSAFKTSGFDTNDPINGWEGSAVEEVVNDDNHAANFTTVERPKRITVVFTLSDMVWGAGEEVQPDNNASSAGSGYKNTAVFSTIDFTDMDSVTLTKYLGNGINLGNTFEAYGHGTLGTNAAVKSYETLWGQPYTTKEIIQGMKDCGFDTIRIPVAWTNMMAYEDGDYTINTKLLDRVQEVVDWAIEAEMFVVVNDHWDGGWWGMFGSKTPETVDKAWAIYENMWTQVAERFKDYPDLLIFESANEELGNSLNDNTVCTDSGALSENGKYEMITAINQKFVDVVRSTGGNNTDRFLLIAGYNTNVELTCNDKYKMPTDTASNKLLISVHYYDPWNYCGTEKDARWGLKKEYKYMLENLSLMKKFTDAGYGVIIGEYGALPIYDKATHSSVLKQNTYEYTENFLDVCDYLGLCPVLWSCNDFYLRKAGTMIDERMLEIYTSRCYAEEIKNEDNYIAEAKQRIDEATNNALDMWQDVEVYEPGTNVAWIMWNGGAGTYSVGDAFNPADNTDGIKATNAVVTSIGTTYTVSLDFAGGNNGVSFAALAIADGEIAFPNSVIQVTSVTIDGKEVAFENYYTASDDGKCTRVNLFNQWVSKVPTGARALGDVSNATAQPLNPDDTIGIKNLTIQFKLIKK